MSIDRKLSALRQEKGESLQDVAAAVGASRGHIWELETGKSKNPSIELIRRLADHFQVSVAWLVGEVPFRGEEKEQFVALYRALNDLSPPNLQIIQTIVEGMRKSGK